MIGVPGGCTVCDKTITEGGRPTQDHSQVVVKWSNGADMTVGVCRDCATSHAWGTEDGKKKITAWHHAYWDRAGARYDKGVVLV